MYSVEYNHDNNNDIYVHSIAAMYPLKTLLYLLHFDIE